MATIIERLELRTGETDTALLEDLAETAKNAIQSRRFPFGDWPSELEDRYIDLQFRIALDMYEKLGAEGQLRHSENGISREYESSWVSRQLLEEVVPWAGVPM